MTLTHPVYVQLRTRREQETYMAGQLAALRLVQQKGLDYAERIVGASHAGIRDAWAEPRTLLEYERGLR